MLTKNNWWCFILLIGVGLTTCTPQQKKIKIMFAGDLLLDRGVRKHIERAGKIDMLNQISPLFHQADAVVANLECPVTDIKQPINKRFSFRGDPYMLAAIKAGGVNYLAMANNHTNDQGRNGMIDTYNNLVANNIKSVGFGNNQDEACSPTLITKDSIHVAIYNSVQLQLEDWNYLADSPGICQARVPELANNIKAYKQAHKDYFVVVVLHWGIEYNTSPSPEQIIWAHQLIDAGADAIIGHHPHVIQTVGQYKGKPIYYSLGNFVFDQSAPGDSALIAELDFIPPHTVKAWSHPIKIKNCTPYLIDK